jgi:aminoglycoside phosphotransferase family enzyme
MSEGPMPSSPGCVTASLEDKVAALRLPSAYEGQQKPITAIETHFAWVFLTDEHAFKLKKPVDTAYLNLCTAEARRLNCLEELRLNQRLAAGVYLDLVPLTMDTGGSIRVGGRGLVIDWLVKMRRLPAELMLDRAMATGRVSVERLAVVGRMLARFYREQPYVEFEPNEYVARLRSRIEEDRSDLLAPDLNLSATLVESVAAAQAAACDKVGPELMQRARERRIVEGHGDLRPEHICLTYPPCIIDSLEFSLDLRTLDPGEELSYLWVECERLGDVSPAEIVLSSYRSEINDPITSQLLAFYRSRRATVRAKLAAWHLRDPAFEGDKDWRAKAEGYLELARTQAAQVH